MKTKIFTSICALFFIIGVSGQKTTIKLTFTGTNNEANIQLDSIRVVNQTQLEETLLTWPDTTLWLTDHTGINELNSTGEHLQVFQNYPNPVKDQTTIRMFIPERDKVGITVTDILGRIMFKWERILERGYHTFRYLPGESEICFFSAFWQGSAGSIKILSTETGSGQKAYLEYTGNTVEGPHNINLKSIQDLIWTLGDTLQYTGYATIDNTILASDIKTDAPMTDMTYTFDILKGLRCSGDHIIMDIDGNAYLTLKIGDQCWMAENLKTTKLSEGTGIPHITDNTEWENLSSSAYCWYDNNISYKNPYGALYNWFTVGTGHLCPTGWHVPTNNEWTILTDYLGGVDVAGIYLKEKGTMHWQSSTGATNETGFTAVGGGNRGAIFGLFLFMREYGYWWSSTLELSGQAWYRQLRHNTNSVSLFPTDRRMGHSVRCIRND